MTEQQRLKIAERLKRAREAAGLSQGQAAKRLKMHRPTISEIEAGRRRVQAEELSSFAELYGVGASWLLNGYDEALDTDDERVVLAARELGKMREEDLARLMELIRMIRTKEEG
jgi:transcriptional regulator with XRE-family HTH domain